MRKSTPREKLTRLVNGVDSGYFELESFEPKPVYQRNLVVVEIVLKRRPSSDPQPKKRRVFNFEKQVRELIFEDDADSEVTGQRWADG